MDKTTPAPSINELLAFLKSRPQPVAETVLLREFLPGAREALKGSVSLELFRYHFLLYHSLYRLAEELEQSDAKYLLYIKTINVYLLKKPAPGFCRYFDESKPGFCGVKTGGEELYCAFHRLRTAGLRDAGILGDAGTRQYYLHLDNMESADEQTLKMWEQGIFRYAASHEEIDRSLKVLGLSADFSLKRLKNRYRYLCKQHHPDTACGAGRRQDFSEIQHAYQVLQALREGEES